MTVPRLDDHQVAAYLERIGLTDAPPADLGGLTTLHRAHLHTIPFENLDIHLGVPIVLEPDVVFDKLVESRRGGFCYEHNSLFARLLVSVGFTVELLSCRVAMGPRGWGPAFDHMALRVTLDRPYLADVGFGDSFRDPLPFPGRATDILGIEYEAVERDDGVIIRRVEPDNRLGRFYLVDPTPRELSEYGPMCTFQQTSPDVWFTQTWVAKLLLADGRATLTPGWLTTTRSGIVTRTEVTTVGQTEELLRTTFGMRDIELPADFPISRSE